MAASRIDINQMEKPKKLVGNLINLMQNIYRVKQMLKKQKKQRMSKKFTPQENWILPPIIESKDAFENRYPYEIGIQLMDICNLKCKHCYLQAKVYNKKQKGLMKYDYFLKILERIRGILARANSVHFCTVEALMHPRIFDIMESIWSVNSECIIRITTNGMLLTENRVKKINQYKNKIRLNISLDGCNKKTVEGIKTGVNFDKLKRGMLRLKKYGISFNTNIVISRANIGELFDYIPFCKEHGVTDIRANPIALWKNDISKLDDNTYEGIYDEQPIKIIDNKFAAAQSIAHSLHMNFFYRRTQIKPLGCGTASYTMFIDMNGNILSCWLSGFEIPFSITGHESSSKITIWGNIFEQDPYQIWTSKQSVDFRRIIHSRRSPKSCSGCPLGELGIT